MKKVVLGTALLVAVSSASMAKFDGAYVQAEAAYAWANTTLKDADDGQKTKFNLNGFGGLATVGYGENCGSVYLAGEVYGGAFGGNKTRTERGTTNTGAAVTSTFKIRRQWNAGIAGRIGGHIDNNILAYFRLGVDYARYQLTGNLTVAGTTVDSAKKSAAVWSLVPGIGADMKISHNVYATIAADYSFAFNAPMPKAFSGIKYDKKPQSITLRLGVGYQF